METFHDETRRSFLKKLLIASIISGTSPHILLGKQEPEIIKDNSIEAIGVFDIDIVKYPDLQNDFGSVKIKIPGLKFNYPTLILSRVPEDISPDRFTCLEDQCPHQGYTMAPFNLETGFFVCTGQGSMFDIEGIFFSGPADKKNLIRRPIKFDGSKIVSVQLPFPYSVIEAQNVNDIEHLGQNYPNPCGSQTYVEYQVDKPSRISIKLYSVSGDEVLSLVDKFHEPGNFNVNIDVTSLPEGAYIYKMNFGDDQLLTKKMIVKR